MKANEIFIDFSNNETVKFQTVSSATNWLVDMFFSDIVAIGLRCSNTSDYVVLQDYIEELKLISISQSKEI
jgi:hypothetical protein